MENCFSRPLFPANKMFLAVLLHKKLFFHSFIPPQGTLQTPLFHLLTICLFYRVSHQNQLHIHFCRMYHQFQVAKSILSNQILELISLLSRKQMYSLANNVLHFSFQLFFFPSLFTQIFVSNHGSTYSGRLSSIT